MAAASDESGTAEVWARRAFTLVELLIVMGIIALLVGLLLPMVHRAYKNAGRSRMLADIQTISQGLEAYKNDQKDYPRTPAGQNPIDGAVLLCWTLLAPGSAADDGAEGPGFRQRGTSGQVYGPYIASERIRVGNVVAPHGTTSDDQKTAFLDRYDQPIYYCPAKPFAIPSQSYVDDIPGAMYDPRYMAVIPKNKLQMILGDADNNGKINGNESAVFIGDYILWGAGMDQDYVKSPITNFMP